MTNHITRFVALTAGTLVLGSAGSTPARAGEAAAPSIVMVFPSANGQVVTTMRNSELHPILGTVNSPNGINRCTVFVKRVSDSYYWDGLAWVSSSVGLAATVTPKSPSPPYFDYRVDAGPNAAAITDGAQYLVRVDCWDVAASLGTASVTVLGDD